MGKGLLGLLLLVSGFFFIWLSTKVPSGRPKAVVDRLDELSFLALGLIGAGGWIGNVIDAVADAVVEASSEALCAGAIGVVTLAVTAVWGCGFLPKKWVNFDMPKNLSMCGALIPSLVWSIPGDAGDAIRSVLGGVGEFTVTLFVTLFGGQ